MTLVTRTRAAGILAISVLMLGAPGALAGDSYAYQPNAQIRLGSGSYVGGGWINTTALGQHVSNSGVVDQKLTFFIKITNAGVNPDSYKVKRSGFFDAGYRVRYYDAATNDVTGQVNTGTFSTPSLAVGGEYVMRATVKIRPQATACSHVTRLITATSVHDSSRKDAVRFAASLAPNCVPVAVDDTASITEDADPDTVAAFFFANDTDPDGDPLLINYIDDVGPWYGTGFSFSSEGTFSFTLDNTNPAVDGLNDNQTLTQLFQYSATDGNGGTTNIATLTITVHGVTDPCVRATGC